MTVSGNYELRKENIDRMVKGFALQEYKMKQLVSIETSGAWKETYWQEDAADLTANGTRSTKGISRGAAYPTGEVNWTEKSKRIIKFGFEGELFEEDIRASDIDVLKRTLLRIARGVTKQVDSEIWDTITESQTPSLINSVTATAAWDAASGQDPIADILEAKRLIEEANYDVDGRGFLVLSPKDYESLATWLISTKGSSIPEFSSEKVVNGKVGTLLGLTVIKSNTVTADYALVVIAKEVGTWKQMSALKTDLIKDPEKKTIVRVTERGVTQLINPKAASLISNTQA